MPWCFLNSTFAYLFKKGYQTHLKLDWKTRSQFESHWIKVIDVVFFEEKFWLEEFSLSLSLSLCLANHDELHLGWTRTLLMEIKFWGNKVCFRNNLINYLFVLLNCSFYNSSRWNFNLFVKADTLRTCFYECFNYPSDRRRSNNNNMSKVLLLFAAWIWKQGDVTMFKCFEAD